MNEILTSEAIEKDQYENLSKALADNRICIVKGLKGTLKMTSVLAILESENRSYQILSKKDYKGFNEGEKPWSHLFDLHNGATCLVLDEAEFVKDWTAFLDAALANESVPQVVLVTSFEPEIDEAYATALMDAGALIHWQALSFGELAQKHGMGSLDAKLEEVLVYGTVDSVLRAENKEEALKEILTYWEKGQWSADDRINKREQQLKVLKILAFQMGEILSFNEIGIKCGLDNETVERYVQLFEKAFLIRVVNNFTTGQKYEMKKGLTVYFTDNGIRNALIQNFTPLDWRMDADQLWQNWLLIERQKFLLTKNISNQLFTWRSLTKTSVDLIEQSNDQLRAYQVAWNKKEKRKFPIGFKTLYPDAKLTILTRASYWTYLFAKK